MLRVGQGLDVHRIIPGDHVMLGGLRIPCDFGVDAHSDGDVLVHALCDALLGAAGMGDIGQHFPDSDPAWSGAAGASLLAAVIDVLGEAGWKPVNADLTLIAEQPRIGPHREAMRLHVAQLVQLAPDAVNIKATTTEKLGLCGRGEGIAAMATVMIERD